MDNEPVVAKGASIQNRPERFDKELAEGLVILSLLIDCILGAFALGCGFWLRFNTAMAHWGGGSGMTLSEYGGHIAVGTLSLALSLSMFGVYNGHLLLATRQVVGRVVQACIVWLAGFLSFSLILQVQPQLSRLYVAVAGGCALMILAAWRVAFHNWLRSSSMAARLRQRVLFVGWNDYARQLVSAFAIDRMPGFDAAGYVTTEGAAVDALEDLPVPALGTVSDIPGILAQEKIDIVIMSDCDAPKAEIVHLAGLCEKEVVHFKLIPSYFQILISGMHVDSASGVPVLGVSKLPLDLFFNEFIKRLLDIVGSIVGLALSLPLILICGALIYCESPGPVFFAQERVGRKGRRFKMFKLRSMRLGSERSDHLSQSTVKGDTRLLKVGAVLRRWSLDELPQFWNVLRGDMSLVGPRPERTFHSEALREIIPHYNARYIARPGITGWAQVNGLRGEGDLVERVRHDLYYIENWSIIFDIKIMAKTFLVCNSAC